MSQQRAIIKVGEPWLSRGTGRCPRCKQKRLGYLVRTRGVIWRDREFAECATCRARYRVEPVTFTRDYLVYGVFPDA